MLKLSHKKTSVYIFQDVRFWFMLDAKHCQNAGFGTSLIFGILGFKKFGTMPPQTGNPCNEGVTCL